MKPARIGILIPSTNTTVEADFQRVLTDQVTAHSARLYIPDGTMTEEFLNEMNRDLEQKVRLLASAQPDVIVYACTSGSFYRGPEFDEQVRRTVEHIAGVPCVTTSTAVSQALRALGLQSLSVVTPYPEWTNEKLVDYYRNAGFHVVSVHRDPRAAARGHRAINDQDPAEILQFGLDHFDSLAQGLFCSCTAWRAMECVPELEAELGVPVVTSNQATIWAALRAIDRVDAAGPAGRLFAGPARKVDK